MHLYLSEWPCNDRPVADGAKCDIHGYVVARDVKDIFAMLLDKVIDKISHSSQIILRTDNREGIQELYNARHVHMLTLSHFRAWDIGTRGATLNFLDNNRAIQ